MVKRDICALLISLVSITQPRHPPWPLHWPDTMRVTMALILAPTVFRSESSREHEPVMRRDVVTVVCKAAQPRWK